MTVTVEGVREWPILMKGPLVEATFDDQKTETRRVPAGRWKNLRVGDRLWVRESFDFGISANPKDRGCVWYVAGGTPTGKLHPESPPESEHWCRAWKRRPSIHMPRWACRLVLEVTAFWIERLQVITPIQIKAEGIDLGDQGSQKDYVIGMIGIFREGWDRLNAARGYGWDKNPEVKVIQYRRVN